MTIWQTEPSSPWYDASHKEQSEAQNESHSVNVSFIYLAQFSLYVAYFLYFISKMVFDKMWVWFSSWQKEREGQLLQMLFISCCISHRWNPSLKFVCVCVLTIQEGWYRVLKISEAARGLMFHTSCLFHILTLFIIKLNTECFQNQISQTFLFCYVDCKFIMQLDPLRFKLVSLLWWRQFLHKPDDATGQVKTNNQLSIISVCPSVCLSFCLSPYWGAVKMVND